MGRIYCLCAVLFLSTIGWPAAAGQRLTAADLCYRCGDETIYGLTSLIAYLEANPDVDDAFKGPIITWSRARIFKLRAALGPRRPQWPAPCCYTREPLHIR
jgi:hypothetical protein